MAGSYKVRACCSNSGCDYVYHKDVIRAINHESSFSFSMYMNGLEDHAKANKCPRCGERMFYYPVTAMTDTSVEE